MGKTVRYHIDSWKSSAHEEARPAWLSASRVSLTSSKARPIGECRGQSRNEHNSDAPAKKRVELPRSQKTHGDTTAEGGEGSQRAGTTYFRSIIATSSALSVLYTAVVTTTAFRSGMNATYCPPVPLAKIMS